jgi:hypothetical protein
MKDNSGRRLVLRLLTLSVLLAGIVFFASDRPQFTAHATDPWATCDPPFGTCNSTCNPSNKVPCFGDCQYSYFTCLYNNMEGYSHTPLIDPNAACWDNAVSIFDHCMIGKMAPGSSYSNVYADCMASTNDLSECCTQVMNEWWGINGPNCY